MLYSIAIWGSSVACNGIQRLLQASWMCTAPLLTESYRGSALAIALPDAEK